MVITWKSVVLFYVQFLYRLDKSAAAKLYEYSVDLGNCCSSVLFVLL